MCDGGHYPFTRGIEGRYIRHNSLFARIPGPGDSSASSPPLPRLVSSLRTPESLPDLLKWDSDGVLGDTLGARGHLLSGYIVSLL